MFQTRRQRLNRNLLEKNMQAVLLDSPSNLYYYTGFTGGEAVLLMFVSEQDTPKTDCSINQGLDNGNTKKEQLKTNRVYLITDSRYYEQVEKECPDITLIRMENQGFSEYVKELLENYDDNFNESHSQSIVSNSKKSKELMCTIAVEDTMNLELYLKLSNACPNNQFVIAKDAIMESRMIKDEAELQIIAKAEAIGDAAFTHILDYMKPGVTEADIALEIEFFMKRQGASKLSFDTIVASGPNSSMPHAQVTNRKLQMGDFVTMDFGCVYQGYCSDMTRTVAIGEPTEEMRKVYQIVFDANIRAMEAVREGVKCNEIDAVARDYIKSQGYGDYFGHGLGHGVGLDIHEEPRFSPKCDVITKENMVITDEPGIYLPGQFGVRIEDLVVVKKDGYEMLSHSDKQLIVL